MKEVVINGVAHVSTPKEIDYSGWRLPTAEEFKEAYKKEELCFKYDNYWTCHTSASNSDCALRVYFGDDSGYFNISHDSSYVRCVRKINDTLEWYKCDAPDQMTWSEAIKYAESLNTENSINNSQTHYKNTKIEPIEVIEDYNLNFNLGNCIKYILRAEYKGQKESDLEKALWYLKREIGKEIKQ